MAEQNKTQRVSIILQLVDRLSVPAKIVKSAMKSISDTFSSIKSTLSGGAAGSLLGSFGLGFGVFEAIRKGMDAAKLQADATRALRAALGDDVALFGQLTDQAEAFRDRLGESKAGVMNLQAQLLNRGVPVTQVPKATQAAADTAAALGIDLVEAGEKIAQTYGGTVSRELGRAVPALKELSQAELEAGKAADLLEQKFQGRAAALATPRKIELAKLEGDWANFGNVFLNLSNSVLPRFRAAFEQIINLLQSARGQADMRALAAIFNTILGFVEAIALGWQKVIEYLDTSNDPDVQELKDVFHVASDTLDKLADGSLSIRTLADAIGTQLAIIGANFKTYLWDIPVALLANLVAKAKNDFISIGETISYFLPGGDWDKTLPRENVQTVEEIIDKARRDLKDTTTALQTTGDQQGTSDQGLDQDASASAATKRNQEELRKRADDARAESTKLQNDILAIETKGDDDVNKQRSEALRSELDEEFKQRTISLDQYLEGLDKAKSGESNRIKSAIADATEQLNKAQGALDEDLAGRKNITSQTSQADVDKQDIIDLKHLEDILNLKRLILKLTQSQNEADSASVSNVVKGIGQVPQRASADFADYSHGLIGDSQLQQRIAGEMQQIDFAAKGAIKQINDDLARNIFSPDVAAQLRERVSQAAEEAKAKIAETANSVRDIGQAQADASRQLDDSARSGIAGGLYEIETRAKTAKQALIDMVTGFGQAILKIINERLAEQLVGAFDSGTKGGGIFGILGSAISGALGGFFGAGLGGGSAGGATESVGWKPVPGVSFATGGYTGDSSPNTLAGGVHGREFVVNASATSRYRPLLEAVNANIGGRVASFFQPKIAAWSPNVSAGSGPSFGGGSQVPTLLSKLNDAVDNLVQVHSRPLTVAVPVDGDTARRVLNHPDSPKTLADVMLNNRSTFGPAIRQLAR